MGFGNFLDVAKKWVNRGGRKFRFGSAIPGFGKRNLEIGILKNEYFRKIKNVDFGTFFVLQSFKKSICENTLK